MEKNGRQIVRKLNAIVSTLPPMDLKFLCTDARCVYPQRGSFDDHSCDLGQRRHEIPEGILDGVMTGAIALYD